MYHDHEQLEQEVLEALMSGRFDSAWAEPLRAHAAGCASCSDLVLVAGFLRRAGEAAVAEAKPPSAALVWWKAQLRARQEAAQRAVRPIAIAEKAGLAGAVLAVLAAALWIWPRLAAGLAPDGNFSGPRQYGDFFAALFTTGGTLPFAFALAAATGILCLAGAALYTLFAEK